MANKTYDAIVIGGGPGGYACAIRLGQLKQKVAVHREGRGRRRVPQLGMRAEQGAHRREPHVREGEARRSHRPHGGQRPHRRRTRCRTGKSGIVKKLTGGVAVCFEANGAELVYGERARPGRNNVEVKTREGATETIEATKAIVIATGTSTIEIPTFKFDGKQIIGAKEAVSLRRCAEAPARHRRRRHRPRARHAFIKSSARSSPSSKRRRRSFRASTRISRRSSRRSSSSTARRFSRARRRWATRSRATDRSPCAVDRRRRKIRERRSATSCSSRSACARTARASGSKRSA